MGRSEKIDLEAIPVQLLYGKESNEKSNPLVALYLRALHELGYGKQKRKHRRRVWVEQPMQETEVTNDAS